MVVRTNSSINLDLWASYVLEHPMGSVFQSPEMFLTYANTKNNKPLAIAIYNDSKIAGLLLAVIISSGTCLFKPITSRSIILGGPIATNNDPFIIERLLFEYKHYLPSYVVYSEIRPIYNLKAISSSLSVSGFIRQGHYNMYLDIRPEEKVLWEGMHKERRRNIKKAQNAGIVFKEVTNDEEIATVISLIEHTYQRKKVPFSQRKMLMSARTTLSTHIHYFAAFYNKKMVAGQIRLFYRDLAYAWYAGSDESFFKLYPNDYLMWNVICWSRQKGYKVFDFGGGGEPGVPYGVRDYKLKYGCQIDDFGRFVYYHKPLVFKLAKWGMHLIGMKKA